MNAAAKKILIADDDSSIRLVLSQAFSRLGYQVRATGNASTLLKWVSEGEGDLVVTDVVMPDENVFDVLPRKTRPEGLPGRPWFTHDVYAPGFYTGYGVKTLPAIREALEERQWAQAAQQVEQVARTLDRFSAEVERLAAAQP